jgi:hypothetical protein
MDDFVYDTPVQGTPDMLVTRQAGLDPAQQQLVRDPQPPQKIVQGDSEVHAYRNPGNGSQFFGGDGTLYSDAVAQDHTLYADRALIASGEQMPPPGIARTGLPMPDRPAFVAPDRAAIKAQAEALGFVVTDGAPVETKTSPTAFGVIASDDGGGDPRDMGDKGPMVFSADQLPVVKKRPVTALVLPTPKVRRVKAKVGR